MKEMTVRDLIHLLRRVDLIDATVRIAVLYEVHALHPTIAKVVEGDGDGPDDDQVIVYLVTGAHCGPLDAEVMESLVREERGKMERHGYQPKKNANSPEKPPKNPPHMKTSVMKNRDFILSNSAALPTLREAAAAEGQPSWGISQAALEQLAERGHKEAQEEVARRERLGGDLDQGPEGMSHQEFRDLYLQQTIDDEE